jgi:hypothetical protein
MNQMTFHTFVNRLSAIKSVATGLDAWNEMTLILFVSTASTLLSNRR